MSHALVVEQMAWEFAEKVRLTEAKALIEDIVYAGRHLQNGVTVISNLIGAMLRIFAAQGLAGLLVAKGGPNRNSRNAGVHMLV